MTLCEVSPLERSRDFFHDLTGRQATHVVYAPGRVNLIGEHTDYNGGFVLPMAIELGIYVAAAPRDDAKARIWSAQFGAEIVEIDLSSHIRRGGPSWSNYVRGVLAGLQSANAGIPGFDAAIFATLPAGGGLSSSAALEAAFATLGESLSGVTLDPVKKALICQKAEHVFAGTPCGIMDQFAVIFCQKDHLLLIDCQSQETRLVPMRDENVSVLVVNTMVRHELNDGGYADRRNTCLGAAELLGVRELRDVAPERLQNARAAMPDVVYRRAWHVVTENERTLAAAEALESGAWQNLGELMYASHESLRDDYEVSCDELDLVVDLARDIGLENGVYGCRMTGGGFGGCCVALVRTDAVPAVSAAIRAGYSTATNLDPVLFASRPAAGARVLVQPGML